MNRSAILGFLACLIFGLSSTARAQPAQPPPDAGPTEPASPPKIDQPATPQRHTAADVKNAPAPEQASGMSRGERVGGRGNTVARVLFFPVRVVLWVVDAPVRGSLWLYERYRLRDRWKAVFFNDEETIGLYPVVFFQSGFGLEAGVRFIHRDLLGHGERLKARASFGGRFQQIYAAQLDTGRLAGEGFQVELDASYEIRPGDRFFGVGNGDEVGGVAAPVDPYDDPAAVATRYQEHIGRLSALGDVALVGDLSARVSSALFRKRFAETDRDDLKGDEGIEDVYQTGALPAFEDGASYVYHELELRYDSRRRHNRFEAGSLPSQGLLASAYTGLASGFAGAPTDYVRYGTDVQLYLRLGPNPRVLVVRGLVEGVAGDLEQVPFTDLPRLGGPVLLRGYDQDRFRDRAMALGSIEYQFDLSNMLSAFTFVDAGRVYDRISDIREDGADDVRIGYGGGLQLATERTFLGRFTVASSVDGGILLHLSLDPVYDPKARVERN